MTCVVVRIELRVRANCMRERVRAEVKLRIGGNVLSVGIVYRRESSLGTLGVAVRVMVEPWRERGVGRERTKIRVAECP